MANRAIADTAPLLVEASNRRFYRVWLGSPALEKQSLVVMDSPPELEQNSAFVAVQKLLRRNGLHVPQILAMDSVRGFFLLGDLGNQHLEDAYGSPLQDTVLTLAIDSLIRLQRIDAPNIPPYEESRFRDELNIFVEWFLHGLLSERLPQAAADAFEVLIDNTINQSQCLIHRDYHCRNLMLIPNGELGIVDFQDALIGPAAYDLACLLWDCYYRFDDAERRRWQSYYKAKSPFSFSDLSRALDLTGLQRQLKAIGIFARLKLRDSKETHLQYIEPVLDSAIGIALAYPDIAPLGRWLEGLAASASRRLLGR